MNPVFIWIGSTEYFDSIMFSINQTRIFYPKSKLYIYDIGFTATESDQLKKIKNLKFNRWSENFKFIKSIDSSDWNKIDSTFQRRIHNSCFKKIKFAIKNVIHFLKFKENPKKYRIENQKKREIIFIQKPFCILDCLKKEPSNNIIYLDSDAFLFRKIDTLFNQDFHVGVTIRRQHEIRNEYNQCQVLNAGVLFFQNDREAYIDFVEKWINKMEVTHEYLIEQSALTRLLESEYPEFWKRNEQLELSTRNIKVKILKCEEYNYNWVEEGIEKDGIRIIHLKSGRDLNSFLDKNINAIKKCHELKN